MPGVDLHHYFVAMRDFVVNWWPLLGLTFYILLLYIFWRMLQLMPKVKPAEVDTKSRSAVTWSDVAGVDEVRAELQEVVDFLRNPRKFERLGVHRDVRRPGGGAHPPSVQGRPQEGSVDHLHRRARRGRHRAQRPQPQ